MLRCGISYGMLKIAQILRKQPPLSLCCKAQMGHAGVRDAIFPPAMDGRHRSFDQLCDSGSAT